MVTVATVCSSQGRALRARPTVTARCYTYAEPQRRGRGRSARRSWPIAGVSHVRGAVSHVVTTYAGGVSHGRFVPQNVGALVPGLSPSSAKPATTATTTSESLSVWYNLNQKKIGLKVKKRLNSPTRRIGCGSCFRVQIRGLLNLDHLLHPEPKSA